MKTPQEIATYASEWLERWIREAYKRANQPISFLAEAYILASKEEFAKRLLEQRPDRLEITYADQLSDILDTLPIFKTGLSNRIAGDHPVLDIDWEAGTIRE